METTNWIEKIKEAVRIAMNKGLDVRGKYQELLKYYFFTIEGGFEFFIYLDSNSISIHTKKGQLFKKYCITDRDDLELKTLVLSIKEYNEDIAVSELEGFISDKKEDSKLTINDLDNEDD
jgi:hypothetical protein